MAFQRQKNGASALQSGGEDDDQSDDICPVCKSSRYLNPHMRFLVNPECYHKMCESCVDRIFSAGPAPCPIAGCRRTLRKHRFRPQTFADVQVEREVDVRKRVSAVFNRREEEFETLRDYNDYLEMVEGITFNLVNGIDVQDTERRLDSYRQEHARDIKRNANLASDEHANFAAQEAAAKEQIKLRREASRREEEEAKREVEESRRRVLDNLAKGHTGEAEKIANDAEKALMKKTAARQADDSRRRPTTKPSVAAETKANGTVSSDTFVIRGLKKVEAKVEEKYDPFDGLEYKYEYHNLAEHYEWDWLDEARTKAAYTVGGYDVDSYCQRALLDAFAGLGVFVSSEANTIDEGLFASAEAVATVATKSGSKPKKDRSKENDDVF